METFGMRGEREIRFYTLDYINWLATGLSRPSLNVPLEDRFERAPLPGFEPDPLRSIRR